MAVARELTKRFEEVWRGTLDEARAWLETVEPRGEHVLVVGPDPSDPSGGVDGADHPGDESVTEALADRLAAGDDPKAAVAAVTAALGVPRRRVYDLAVALRKAQRQPGVAR